MRLYNLTIKKIIHEPLVHFLLIGAGLFLLFGWKGGTTLPPGGPPGAQSATIVVIREDIARLVETFTQTLQRPPTREERQALIDDHVRNEIYYREAVAAGLDRDDSVIQRRLRMKMEYIFEDIAAQQEPTDEELLAYMQIHSDRYLSEPKISFRHVYLNLDKRGQRAEADARQVLARLNQGAAPTSLGDPFLLNSEIDLLPISEIRGQFGESFATRLLELVPGQWQGPVRSGFGLHLVFVPERVEAKLPELEAVRATVKRDLMAERQNELKDNAYAKLRRRYRIIVEKPPTPASTAVAEAAMRTENR